MIESAALVAEIPRLRRYARALMGTREGADDLVQETLTRAWERAGQLRPGSDLRAWLFGIMHNLRMDEWRRHPERFEAFDESSAEWAVRPMQMDRLEVAALDWALAQLPEAQRQVLLLVGLEELPYDQVAEIVAVPVGTVMSRLSRGRERLRRLLADESPPVRLRVIQ